MIKAFRIDQKLTELLAVKPFTVSAEVIPPRNGSPQTEILEQISKLVDSGAQYLSVTKGAGGSLRGGSLPIAQAIKDHFQKPAIAHFTCRDLTPEEVENQLMDHHYFGIRNILALRGDPPQGVKDWIPHPKSYPYAYQLIAQIKKMNEGHFLKREGFQSQFHDKTDFCVGASAYPDEPSLEARLQYFSMKVKAGAEYGITQMLYDVDSYKRFLDECAAEGIRIPVLPGLRILKSKSQAIKMRDRFQISMPEKFLESLPDQENPSQALQVFVNLVTQFRQAGAPGVHVFVLSDTELSCQGVRALLQ